MQTKQSVADQILEARAILDEIYGDAASPLHDPKHPRHGQVSQAVADLEAELYRLTCVEEIKKKNSAADEIVKNESTSTATPTKRCS
jgi:hypothetical protein